MAKKHILNKPEPKRFRLDLVSPTHNGDGSGPAMVGDGIVFRDGICAYQREGVEMIHVADSTRDVARMEVSVEIRWDNTTPSRRFQLHRHRDVGGLSGTGIVAEGIRFGDGQCAYRWLTSPCTTQIAPSITAVKSIHGHGGKTKIHWLDDEQ